MVEISAPEKCCIEGSVNVNLENGVQKKGSLPGITNLTPFAMPTTTTHPGNQCMTRAAFKINFQHIMPLFGCVKVGFAICQKSKHRTLNIVEQHFIYILSIKFFFV